MIYINDFFENYHSLAHKKSDKNMISQIFISTISQVTLLSETTTDNFIGKIVVQSIAGATSNTKSFPVGGSNGDNEEGSNSDDEEVSNDKKSAAVNAAATTMTLTLHLIILLSHLTLLLQWNLIVIITSGTSGGEG